MAGNYSRQRKCADCFPVKIKQICNGLGKNVESFQDMLIEKAGGKYVSKPQTVMKILRLFFENGR